MLINEITSETRVIDLTVGQLCDIIRQQNEKKVVEEKPKEPARPIRNIGHGRKDVCKIFKCKETAGSDMVKRIDGAIFYRNGNSFLFDIDKAFEILEKERKND